VKTTAASLAAFALAIISTITGAAPTAPALAATQPPAPNWYNVEVIVFRVVDPAAGSDETWPADPGMPDWNGSVALNPPNSIGPAVPYQALSPVNEQLDEDWTRLKRSHNYQPLVHATWTQPALDRATAQTVRIGVPPSAVPAAATHPMPATPAPSASTATAAPLQATLAYGDAKLSTTGPYLHFDLDLVLQGPLLNSSAPGTAINATALAPPASTVAAAMPAFSLYRLRQDRRIDAGKTSYFDQPLFGAIVLVTPIRRPQ
jgi:hypothetical protein